MPGAEIFVDAEAIDSLAKRVMTVIGIIVGAAAGEIWRRNKFGDGRSHLALTADGNLIQYSVVGERCPTAIDFGIGIEDLPVVELCIAGVAGGGSVAIENLSAQGRGEIEILAVAAEFCGGRDKAGDGS